MSGNPDSIEQQAIAAAEAGAVAHVHQIEMIIDQWTADMIHGSPVARDTPGFNHLHTLALPELRRRLLKGLVP